MLGILDDLELQTDLIDSGMLKVPSQDDISTEEDAGDSVTGNTASDSVTGNTASDSVTGNTASDSVLATAHIAVEQTKRQLRGMKRKFALTTLSDPEELKNVKIAIDLLKNAMKEKIPQDDDSFKLGLENVVKAYQSLIESCQIYDEFLNSRKILFRQDKLMREMIRQIVQQSIVEQTAFQDVVQQDYFSGIRYAGKDWTDVLYAIRAVRLDEDELESTGANTSELKIVKNPDGKTVSFVKQEERTLTTFGKDDVSTTIEILNMFAEIGDEKRKQLIDGVIKNRVSLDEIDTFVRNIKINYFGDRSTPRNQKRLINDYIAGEKDGLGVILGDSLEDFIKFVFRKFTEYLVAYDTAAIVDGSVISDRNVSTTRVAERLGVDDLVAKSKTVLVRRKDGSFAKANSMEGVTGPDVITITKLTDKLKSEWKNYRVRFEGKAIEQLFELQILDLICAQIDRNFGNIMAIYQLKNESSECVIESIKGIDNDLSFGNADTEIVHPTYRSKPFLGQSLGIFEYGYGNREEINVPFISKRLYERIMLGGMVEIIQHDQMDLRSQTEIQFLRDRFNEVKKTIDRLVTEGKMHIIEDEKEFEDRFYNRTGQGTQMGENYITRILSHTQ